MSIKVKGYALGAIAAATYGMNPLFALPLYKCGMNSDSVLFFRYLFAIPLIGIMLKARGRSFKMYRNEAIPLIIMGILVALSSLFLFESYNYMAAGIASTLLFIYPIIVATIMTAVFKEKIKPLTIACIALAVCGIGLLYKDDSGSTLSLTGTIMVFMSALTYAIYIVGINHSILKEVSTLKVTFYVLIFGLSVFLFRFAWGESIIIPDANHWYLWGNLLLLAIFPTAISFLCTTSAIQYIGATPTAILGALEPLTAIVIGVLVFDETLTARIGIGLILIIAAVTAVIASGSITTYLIRFRKLFPRITLRRKQR